MGHALELFKKSRVRVIGKKSNPNNLRAFLTEFQRTGVIQWACKKAGFSESSFKWYLAKSEAEEPGFVIPWDGLEGPFHELFRMASDNVVDAIEGHANHRALGYEEVLTFQGHIKYQTDWDKVKLLGAEPGSPESFMLDERGRPIPETITKQSEDLQMFILKARRPDIYGTKAQLDVKHHGGVMVVGTRAKSSAELEEAERRLLTEPPVDAEFVEVPENE